MTSLIEGILYLRVYLEETTSLTPGSVFNFHSNVFRTIHCYMIELLSQFKYLLSAGLLQPFSQAYLLLPVIRGFFLASKRKQKKPPMASNKTLPFSSFRFTWCFLTLLNAQKIWFSKKMKKMKDITTPVGQFYLAKRIWVLAKYVGISMPSKKLLQS